MTDKPTPPSSPNDSAEKMNGGEENSSLLGNEAGVMVAIVPPAVGEALLAERLDELINDLEEAFGGPPESGKERKPYIDALVVVSRFARSVGCSENAWRGLSDLAYALQDRDDGGREAPVLRQTKRKGNSPDSNLIWMKRARVLVAMHALQKADPDLKHTAAARHIAQKFPGLRRLMTRGKGLPGTILRWRRELEEAKQGEFLAQFSQQMVDMEKFVAQQSLSADQLRNFAYNGLARI